MLVLARRGPAGRRPPGPEVAAPDAGTLALVQVVLAVGSFAAAYVAFGPLAARPFDLFVFENLVFADFAGRFSGLWRLAFAGLDALTTLAVFRFLLGRVSALSWRLAIGALLVAPLLVAGLLVLIGTLLASLALLVGLGALLFGNPGR